MSDREEIEHEGDRAGQRPRREPRVIDGDAIEIPLEPTGPGPGGSPPRRMRDGVVAAVMSLTGSRKAALAIAAGVVAVAVVGAGAAWIYGLDDGSPAPPRSGDVVAPAAPGPGRPATAATTPPALPDRGADGSLDAERESRLETRLTAVTTTLSAINERLAALEGSVRDSADAARAAAARADQAIAGFEEARRNGDERQAAQQLDRGALDDLSARLKTLEARQMTMRQMQDRLDRLSGSTDKAVRAALAAATLRNAVERERPFPVEFAAARALDLDGTALTALAPFAAAGVPRSTVLLRELSELLPDLRRAAAPPDEDLGYINRLQAGAVRMLRIRPVKDEAGDDPAAVLSRIEFKMAHDDIDAVIAELDKLPAAVKSTVEPWRAKAVARRDALEALRRVTAATLAKLGDESSEGEASPQ